MKTLRPFFYAVDFGFVLYWTITALDLIPKEYLFENHADPLLVAWNWSFMPLDVAVSVTGLLAVHLWNKKDSRYENLALISLALTTASGFQAVSF